MVHTNLAVLNRAQKVESAGRGEQAMGTTSSMPCLIRLLGQNV